MSSLSLRVVAALVALTTTLVPSYASSPQETPRELIEKVKDQKDRSAGAWFETLGSRRDAAGLKALEQALGIVKSEAKLSEVARALRHFAGVSPQEARALQLLRDLALDRKPSEARAGTKGLVAFGPPALDTLRSVIPSVTDDVARALGLPPLLPELIAAADVKSVELVLAAWRSPHSGSRDRGLEVLRAFRSVDALAAMGRVVSNEDAARPVRELVLGAVAGMQLNGDALEEADEVIDRGLVAKDDAVRYRALEATVARGRALRKQPIELLTRSEADELRRLAHVALARLELGDGDAPSRDVLNLARSKDPAARQAAALELARLGTDDALDALAALLTDPDARVRSEAIRAVAARRKASSVVTLIDRLDGESGKLRLEVHWALRMLTGVDNGSRSPRWRAWWKGEGATFEIPSLAAAQQAEDARKDRKDDNSSKASFYGLQVLSDRLAFVIDVSGSMNAKAYAGKTRLETAKEELSGVVERLQADDRFNVIAFSTGVNDWVKELVAADQKRRGDALAFIQRLRPNGGTAIYDGLARAFADTTVDTIYLLTDGDPSGGLVTDPAEIRSEVARWNSSRKVTIHCVAVGQDRPLLRELAADSGGTYTRID
ncbi:MAG: VWA domain-containing protein [Planctomycetota bacterium]